MQQDAGVAQLVERQPSKLNVAGSNPVSRSKKPSTGAALFCRPEPVFTIVVSLLNYRWSDLGLHAPVAQWIEQPPSKR